MIDAGKRASPGQRLGASARASLLWSGGFTLLRDVAQFGVMLVLVRLLSPADYGTAALTQSIIGLAAVVSFVTFSAHALQLRDPTEIDWQSHFTAAAIVNVLLFCVMLAVAWALSFTSRFYETALPLAALSVVFLVEIFGTLRHRMLEAQHEWGRFRILLMLGTLLGLGAGLVVAMLGGGVWALIVQPPMFGLPAAIDLFFGARFRPDWAWDRARYRDTMAFGLNRIGAGALGRGRIMTEQAALAGAFDLSALGIFTRAMGLGTLLAGRIGSVAMMALYPVITRAERGSPRFQRLSGLVLRGVCWATAPAALLLAVTAADTVQFLYGSQWVAVVPLLPLVACVVGLSSIATTLSSLLLANDDAQASLVIDLLSAGSGIALALSIVPFGASIYLAALGVLALCVVSAATALLLTKRGIAREGVVSAFVPAIVAGGLASAAVAATRHALGESPYLVVRLGTDVLVLGMAYIATLRIGFARPLAELLEVLPGGKSMAWGLRLGGGPA